MSTTASGSFAAISTLDSSSTHTWPHIKQSILQPIFNPPPHHLQATFIWDVLQFLTMSHNEWVLIDPQELGEPHHGAEDHDMDLHCEKYKRTTPEMREQERIAERRRNGLYFDDPVHNAQKRLVDLIPKNNLRIPYKWFFDDGDAEKVFKAAAKAHDIAVYRLSTTSLTRSLSMLLECISRHRGLRMKNKGDSPRMSLQERRNRHWQAVIDESAFARDFSQGLVRHVTLMLVGAHLAFAESKGSWNDNNGLNDKIVKVSEWLEEYDPEDIKSFESSQPERQVVNAPKESTSWFVSAIPPSFRLIDMIQCFVRKQEQSGSQLSQAQSCP